MTELEQVQAVVENLQTIADRLSAEGRYLDAAQAVGGLQTIRALWTKLNAPAPAPTPEPEPPAPNGEPETRAAPPRHLEAVD
jgi:hypothetical protein